jgi:hypothetical protein
MKLFEYILREADKSRFLKPLWDQFSDQLEDNNITYEELLSFVNKDDPLLKQQFEMRGINWQKKGSDAMLWVAIISAFNARKETNKQKEIEKAAYKAGDVISMIKSEKMLYLAGETEEATDCDFVHLPTLDNDKFTFIVPMTWDACRFCDSAKMGGEGAKWCIGYEQSDSYWKEYTGNGDLFILAFNNEAFKEGKNREKDTLKYMIQLSDDYRNTVAWLQSDNPEDIIPINKFKKVFGRDPIEMATAFANRIMCDDNVYTDNSNGSFYDYENEEATYPWDDNRLVDNEFYIKASKFSWITPDKLDVKKIYVNELKFAEKCISKIDEGKTVFDKLKSIAEAHNTINTTIKFSTGKNDDAGADDLSPIFQYIIIKAKPKRFFSNIYYIK